MDNQKPETKPIIIAMKGHPGTGKTTLAKSLAKSLKFPLIDKDQFRDCTQTIENTLAQFTPPETAATLLNDLSYDAMWRVASAQLGLGLGVIIDSPLSNRARLDRVIGLAAQFGARVAVVECKAKDEAEWRRRLEIRAAAADDGGSSWHKPSTWREMEELLGRYGGCWEYDFGDVEKVVVDATTPVEIQDLVSTVIEFLHSSVFHGLEDKTVNASSSNCT